MPSWETLMDLSEQMLRAARQGDWVKLAELETRRNPLIRVYFADVTSSIKPEKLREKITWLQQVEKDLLSLCMQEKAQISSTLKGLKKGKTAGDAYLANAVTG